MRTLFPALLFHGIACGIGLAQSASTPAKTDKPDKADETKEVSSLKEIISLVPRATVMKMKSSAKMDEAISEANKILEPLKDRPCTLHFKMDSAKKSKTEDGPPNMDIVSMPDRASSGNIYPTVITAHLPEKEEAKVKKLRKGGDVSATGKLKAEFRNDPKSGLKLQINLYSASFADK